MLSTRSERPPAHRMASSGFRDRAVLPGDPEVMQAAGAARARSRHVPLSARAPAAVVSRHELLRRAAFEESRQRTRARTGKVAGGSSYGGGAFETDDDGMSSARLARAKQMLAADTTSDRAVEAGFRAAGVTGAHTGRGTGRLGRAAASGVEETGKSTGMTAYSVADYRRDVALQAAAIREQEDRRREHEHEQKQEQGGEDQGEGEGKEADVNQSTGGTGPGYSLREASEDRLPPAARAAGPAERARLVVRMRLLDAAARGDEEALHAAAEDAARARLAREQAAAEVEKAGMGGRVRGVVRPLVRPRIPKSIKREDGGTTLVPRSFRTLLARRAVVDAVERAELAQHEEQSHYGVRKFKELHKLGDATVRPDGTLRTLPGGLLPSGRRKGSRKPIGVRITTAAGVRVEPGAPSSVEGKDDGESKAAAGSIGKEAA